MSWRGSMLESDHYTANYFNQERVCRLCWREEGIVELTSRSPKSLDNDATIAEKILECVGIDVSTQIHPKGICSNCLEEIEAFSEFKQFCKDTDIKLQDILTNGSPRHKTQRLKKKIASKEYIDDLKNLEKEIDFELKILSQEVKKEENMDKLILKPEIGDLTNYKLTDFDKLTENLLIDNNNYCFTCHLILDSPDKYIKHNLESHGTEYKGFYKCYGCRKKFKSEKLRLNHEIWYCKDLRYGYKCTVCGKYKQKRELLESHLEEHMQYKELLFDIWKCKQCSESFETQKGLKKHMLTHKEKKSFICEICGRVFNRRGNMNTHKLIHTGRKALKCPHCNHRATQQSSLAVHIRIHTGERPYACDICPHRCTTSSNLIKHKNLKHLGIKDFKCKVCEKCFRDKYTLDEHISAVHERSKTHTCKQCGVQYFRFRNLREHLLVKHGCKVRKVKDDFVEVADGVPCKRMMKKMA